MIRNVESRKVYIVPTYVPSKLSSVIWGNKWKLKQCLLSSQRQWLGRAVRKSCMSLIMCKWFSELFIYL